MSLIGYLFARVYNMNIYNDIMSWSELKKLDRRSKFNKQKLDKSVKFTIRKTWFFFIFAFSASKIQIVVI